MNRFRLRTRRGRGARPRLTPQEREIIRARDQQRAILGLASPQEAQPTIDRVNALREALPRGKGAHTRLAEEMGITAAPSHCSPLVRLHSVLKGYRRVYPSELARWNRVLDRYRAAGWPC
jgi:hypothetical protein